MNLKEIIEKINHESLGNNQKAFKNIASSEQILKQAYEGRYFFELIQNVRDANKELALDGKIFIELFEDKVIISNTGGEFSERGIESITNIGDSTKQSQEFIGHKGIGFKSILEITESPVIQTRYGTVFFDKILTRAIHEKKVGYSLEKIPLFFFPHFKKDSINLGSEITTRILLQFKKGINAKKISNDIKNLGEKQLVLLGNIAEINFSYLGRQISNCLISKNEKNNTVEVKNNRSTSFFKNYSPPNKIEIPDSILSKLDKQEKDLFSSNPNIDIEILIELNDKKRFTAIDSAKLYLFYPLEITSGFPFLIHSYFIVSPDRKKLRNNLLNDFLLKKIGEYISGRFLISLKRSYKLTLLHILIFERVKDSGLESLYNSVQDGLMNQKFIYDKISKRFFKPLDVIITDDFDQELFPDNTLKGKRIIFLKDANVINWLKDEFEIEYIDYDTISEVIEEECKKHLKKRNIDYFQNLYNYVIKNEELNLLGKKVLLNSNLILVSSNEDVFYRGKNQEKLELPKSIGKRIHFLHSKIKITDLRDGKSRTGIREFNTYELVKRLLKLFEDDKIPNKDILETLLIIELDKKALLEINGKILLPVKGKKQWLNPLFTPVYFNDENLKELFPKSSFIDYSKFSFEDSIKVDKFLKEIGVWEIPAIYIHSDVIYISDIDSRNEMLYKLDSLYSTPYSIKNDRMIDKPVKFSNWYTFKIIENLNYYYEFLLDSSLPTMEYSSARSSYFYRIDKEISWRYTNLIASLRDTNWIKVNDSDKHYSSDEIVSVEPYEFNQSHTKLFKKYLPVLPIPFILNRAFIRELNIIHLASDETKNFKALFHLIYSRYSDLTKVKNHKEFINFFNRNLSKLFDYYNNEILSETYYDEQYDDIFDLKENFFLAKNKDNIIVWEEAKNIYYKDSPASFKLLPSEVKTLLYPQFTNQDKNTFGKIASKIGKRINRSIEQKFIETSIFKEVHLSKSIKFFSEIIALLEFSIERSLSKEEIDSIKSSVFVSHQEIHIEIKIKDSGDINTISLPFFTEKGSPYKLHIIDKPFNNSSVMLAEPLYNFFSTLIGRDIKHFEIHLKNLLLADDIKKYLEIFEEISEERIYEINIQLESETLNNTLQYFFYTILNIKNIEYHSSFYPDFNVDIDLIQKTLGVKIIDFIEHFNFDNLRAEGNILPLKNFFNKIELTLSRFNDHSNIKISFLSEFRSKVERVKNKLESNFSNMLWVFFSKKNRETQCKYQYFIDRYVLNNTFEIDENLLEFDEFEFFNKWLESTFSEIQGISYGILSDLKITKKPLDYYKKNKRKFIKELKSLNISDEFLADFLSIKEINSLFYFKVYDDLSDIYFRRYKDRLIEKEKARDSFLDLDSFKIDSNIKLNKVETHAIEETPYPKKTGKRKTSKRLDGGLNKKQKERIGFIGEKLVYDLLSSLSWVTNVKWVSKYASKISENHPGYNPEGDDTLGYDLEYLNKNGDKIFIEVKSSTGDNKSFEISDSEIKFALEHKNNYHIFLVNNVLDNKNRNINDLANPFILDINEDFFNNNKFTAVNTGFIIKFK